MMSATKLLCIHTVKHLILEGIFTIVRIKFQELTTASILLYCSNIYYARAKVKQLARIRLLVINWLIEKLKTLID